MLMFDHGMASQSGSLLMEPSKERAGLISPDLSVDEPNTLARRPALVRLLFWLLISLLAGITLFWLGMMTVFFVNFCRSNF